MRLLLGRSGWRVLVRRKCHGNLVCRTAHTDYIGAARNICGEWLSTSGRHLGDDRPFNGRVHLVLGLSPFAVTERRTVSSAVSASQLLVAGENSSW